MTGLTLGRDEKSAPYFVAQGEKNDIIVYIAALRRFG